MSYRSKKRVRLIPEVGSTAVLFRTVIGTVGTLQRSTVVGTVVTFLLRLARYSVLLGGKELKLLKKS